MFIDIAQQRYWERKLPNMSEDSLLYNVEDYCSKGNEENILAPPSNNQRVNWILITYV